MSHGEEENKKEKDFCFLIHIALFWLFRLPLK